jgi:hypothetical protein
MPIRAENRFALAFCVASTSALAAPPPVGSEDWNVMAPYKDWVTTQHDAKGRWCCDIGDGRPVEARIDGDHWEVHVTPMHFPDEQDRWLPVPDEKITRAANPTGTPILWMYQGRVQCFAPPDGS